MTATRWWRLVAGTAAGLLVLVALLLTALRLAIAYVPHNEQKLRTWIERQTQMKFEYSRLDARLRWYGPEVVLRDLRVVAEDGSQALFATREGSVGLDLWNFFRTGQFVAGRVRILEPRVTIVRLADGRIRLLGLRERPADKPPFDFDRLPAGRILIDDATVVFRDLKSGRAPLELTDLDVQLRRDRDFVVMEGAARLPQQLGTQAEFNVRLKGTLDEFEHLDARVEVEAGSVRLAGLQDFLPPRWRGRSQDRAACTESSRSSRARCRTCGSTLPCATSRCSCRVAQCRRSKPCASPIRVSNSRPATRCRTRR